MLEREVGPEVFARIMRTYAERWAFRHPGTDDFLAVASEVVGRRTSGRSGTRSSAAPPVWTTRWPTSAASRCHRPRRSGPLRRRRRDPDLPARAPPTGDTGDARCEVLVERRGDLALPLDVQLTFEDGTRLTRQVPADELWNRITTQRALPGGRVARAEVHPGAPAPLDAVPVNDARSLEATPGPVLTLTGWLLYSAQLLAAAVGSLL